MNCCYIIHSKALQKHYIGACHDDLNDRIVKHNLHHYGNHRFTAKASDWKLILVIECDSFAQATKIEKHIKKMKSAVYIQNLVQYPEMIMRLKEKFKSN